MRSLLLTEEEKKSILGLYSNNNTNSHNSLITEKYRIKKLMNLNEGVDPSKIFQDVPGLKKLGKLMGLASESEQGLTKKVDDFVNDLGGYSSKLQSKGVKNLDDLLKVAREWQEANSKKFGTIVDEAALIDRFIKENKIIEEIETKLINKSLDDATTQTSKSFDELDGLFGFDDVEKAELTDGTKLSEVKTQTEIDDAVTKVSNTEETVRDILFDVQTRIKKLKALVDKNLGEPSQKELLGRLIEQEAKLGKYLKQLEKHKQALVTASEQMDVAKVRGDNTLNFMGKSFDPQVLSPWQRAFYKMGLDKLPEFVTLIIRFVMRVISFKRVKLLQEELAGQMARLIELQRMISSGYYSPELLRELEYASKEAQNLTKNLQGKDISFNYKGNTPNAYEYFVRFIKGSTGFIEAKDISEIWKRVTSILQYSVTEGKITQDEANTILKRIKNAYTNVDSKTGEVTTSDMNGLLMLRSDLDEIAKESGYTKLTEELPTNSEVAAELAKKQSDIPSIIGRWFRSVKEYGLGITTKVWWENLFKYTAGICIKELIYGLPLNLKYYLRPLAKGFNLKNVAIIIGRLALSKAASTVVIGFITSSLRYIYLYNIMGVTELTPDEIENLAWRSWNEEMQKYRDFDLPKLFSDVFSVDKSIKYDYNPATLTSDDPDEKARAKYASEVNYKYGPLRIKFREIWDEFSSFSKSQPTKKELNTYMAMQQQKLNNDTTKNINEKNQKYQDLFYSLDEETQAGAAGSNFKKIMEENEFFATSFTESQRKLFVDRLFYRNHFVGGIPDYKLLDSVDKIRNTFLTITNYAPDACVCKKPLAYTEKDIEYFGETKTCKIPICDDYVRIEDRKSINFYPSKNNPTDWDAASGFFINNSAKSVQGNISDWRPMNELNKYVK
jgi:hypothetical protein